MKSHPSTKGPHPAWGRWALIAISFLVLFALLALPAAAAPKPAPVILDPLTIPKYVNQLTSPPPVYVPNPVTGVYEIDVAPQTQQILPSPMPMTHVWAYGGTAKDAVTGAPLGVVRNAPGPSFETVKGSAIKVRWINNIPASTPHMFAVDPTLHWASPDMNCMIMSNPNNWPFPAYPPGFTLVNNLYNNNWNCNAQYPVPIVTHLHGAEVASSSDGGPEAWWTSNDMRGADYNSPGGANGVNDAIYDYPNSQPATTLWYHDHALGITRINVLSGLAGFYLLRDPLNDNVEPLLPSGKYEVPLAIQDRMFTTTGDFYFPSRGLNPTIHPYWNPEFFGNVIMVNGKVWPNMNVDQGQYRFRFLDGSNARFYTLSFSNKMPFTVIGAEGGYLKSPVTVTEYTIAPGERADVLVDFTNVKAGTKIILQNTGKAPTPRGAPADPRTTGQVMQFTVTGTKGFVPNALPATLNPTLAGATFPTLPAPSKTRILALQEVMGPAGPKEILLDGQKWSAPVSELPALGSTEEWVIVNPTADTHPIHLHLVQFQLVSRQPFNVQNYQTDWIMINGVPPLPIGQATVPLDPTPYLQDGLVGPQPYELAWKDTIQMRPGEVTRIRVRFAPIDGSTSYPFTATGNPGYVWHCHILDHEDNEMMRPYFVV